MSLTTVTSAAWANTAWGILPTKNEWDWGRQWPEFLSSIVQTLQMVCITMIVGGILGLFLGLALYGTRRGGLFQNGIVYGILSFIINFIRPIPFIIFLAAVRPLNLLIAGTSIGVQAALFPMIVMCTMATSRIVEQNLVATDPGIIEAARAMGASRTHALLRVAVPESLGPLVLGYAFLFIGVLDMSAIAGGVISAGGLGAFALQWGYQRYNDLVTWVAVGAMIIMVQIIQQLGNYTARKLIRR